MMESGLLAYLVDQFVARREQVATEALTYLAREYSSVRRALGQLAEIDPGDREHVRYRSEAIDPEMTGRPDIVGEYDDRRLLVVEGSSGLH
jgi:hypothetical protein